VAAWPDIWLPANLHSIDRPAYTHRYFSVSSGDFLLYSMNQLPTMPLSEFRMSANTAGLANPNNKDVE
jgi:hypothetical protein